MKFAIRAILILSNVVTLCSLLLVPYQIWRFGAKYLVQNTFLGVMTLVFITFFLTLEVILKIDNFGFKMKEKFELSRFAGISEYFPIYEPPTDKTGWIYEWVTVLSLAGVNLSLYLVNYLVKLLV